MEIKGWRGLRNTTSPERFRVGDLEVATDVEIDDTGKMLSRRGQTVVDATPAHSLYSSKAVTLIMHDNVMSRIESDFTFTPIRTLTTSDRVSYDNYAGTIYWSNGTDTGRVFSATPRLWGVVPPSNQPTASASSGNLPAGRYLFALTFLRSDGHESGTGVEGAIDVGPNGGIVFSNIEVSSDPDVTDKIIYLSGTNGETLYRAAVIPNSYVTYGYTGNASDLKVALRTQHAGPPPAGNIVRYFNGTMYVVAGDVVYFSDAYNPELFRIGENFLRFPGQVALFECVKNGIFVATTDIEGDDPETAAMTWYLAGGSPADFDSTIVFDYGAIPNTAAKCTAALITSPEASETTKIGEAIVWTSRHGVCVGYNGGSANNLTESQYSFPYAQRGAGIVRQHRGFVQYLNVLRGSGSANNQS